MSWIDELRSAEVERERAKLRQAHGQTAPGRTLPEPVPGATNGEARDAVGAQLGVSGRTVAPTKTAHRPQEARRTQVRYVEPMPLPTNTVGAGAAISPHTAPASPTVDEAALWLTLRHTMHLETTRRTAMSCGLSQRSWERGTDRLRAVGVLDRRGRWSVHDLATVRELLTRTEVRR